MTVPLGSFAIVSYRDFYDVPRLILAMDEAARYWIFDCAFDEELDDYPSEYEAYFAGDDLQRAERVLTLHLQGVKSPRVGIVPVVSLEFDQSKRHTFTLNQRRSSPGSAGEAVEV